MPDTMHPLDRLLCDLQDLVDVLSARSNGQASGDAAGPMRARPTSTAQRQLASQPSGELLGRNERRAGFVVHNATDGTLLISIDEQAADVADYYQVVGPGEMLDTRGVDRDKNVRGALSYAWVTAETDLSGYPAGVFAEATAGALKVTEFTFPHPRQ